MKRIKIPIIDVKKYGGKQVAVVDGKIVAFGKNTQEVFKKVRLRLPKTTWSDILLITVPKGLTVVYPVRSPSQKKF